MLKLICILRKEGLKNGLNFYMNKTTLGNIFNIFKVLHEHILPYIFSHPYTISHYIYSTLFIIIIIIIIIIIMIIFFNAYNKLSLAVYHIYLPPCDR